MSTRMRDAMRERFRELRHEPTEKRLRAYRDGQAVIDTTRALVVWLPGQVVPTFAVPDDAIDASDPAVVSSDIEGYAILDFGAFDRWQEEEEPLIGHPRDPFHRIDIRRSSRHVVIERDGRLLAESTRPTLLFETGLPTRFYIPREDVVAELEPSDRRSVCAYKGEAGYFAVDGLDLVWTYEDPLFEAAPIKDLVAFFDELVDVTVDGKRRARPITKFAKAIA
jgi:uncharacterized protein (DUF427 family)